MIEASRLTAPAASAKYIQRGELADERDFAWQGGVIDVGV